MRVGVSVGVRLGARERCWMGRCCLFPFSRAFIAFILFVQVSLLLETLERRKIEILISKKVCRGRSNFYFFGLKQRLKLLRMENAKMRA